MSSAVAVMWAATWWTLVLVHRPVPGRLSELASRRSASTGRGRGGRRLSVRAGRSVQRLVPVLGEHDPGIVGASLLLLGVSVLLVGPRGVMGGAAVLVGVSWGMRRSRRRRHHRRVERHLVSVAELFAAALRSGLSTRLALEAVGSGHPRAELVGLAQVCRLIERGLPLREALARWGSSEISARPLADLVADAERLGAPLADDLVAFATQRRRDLRRDAEERARRLPVVLLIPLVCCVLPAFVVVAVVPMVVTGASSIVFPS